MILDETNAAKSTEQLLAETPADVLAEADALLRDPELLHHIAEAIRQLGVTGERELGLSLYLLGTSRLLPRPLAAIVQGPSSSGKSYLIEQVATLFPPESVLQATDLTANALYYMPAGRLKHTLVVLGERRRRQDDTSAAATKALREMISSRRLSKSVPIPNATTGELETHVIEQEGPIAYVESTTLTKIFEEDANRCLMLQTDDRQDQTGRIVRTATRAAAGETQETNRDRVIDVLRTLQRLLDQVPVIVPYALELGEQFPTDRIEARRAIQHVLGMIQASALLHQCQRKRDAHGAVVANRDDYALTHWLLSRPMAQSLGGALGEGIKRFHQSLQQMGDRAFTPQQAGRLLKVSDRQARDYLTDLNDLGCVELVEPARGPIAAKWRLAQDGELGEVATTLLPSVESVCGLSEESEVTSNPDLSDVPF